MWKLLVLCCIALSSAAYHERTSCPTVKPVSNFKLSDFAVGTWYEVAKYPNEWEERADCVSTVFTPKDGVYKYQVVDVINHKLVHFDGYMELNDPSSTDAVVKSISPDLTGAGEHSVLPPLNILLLDNNHVAIFYQCVHDPVKDEYHDIAWVGSRSKVLDEDSKTLINSFFKDTNIIDSSKLIWTDFTGDACKSN